MKETEAGLKVLSRAGRNKSIGSCQLVECTQVLRVANAPIAIYPLALSMRAGGGSALSLGVTGFAEQSSIQCIGAHGHRSSSLAHAGTVSGAPR